MESGGITFSNTMMTEIIYLEWRLLTFRKVHINVEQNLKSILAFAVFATWLAGIGRYWDHPNALWWQYAGLGSVLYLGLLSLLLWLVTLPLNPKNWSYLNVFIFVGLTAPPAWLYAIPVEKFTSFNTASNLNMWFLLIVAVWRVILYGLFLGRSAKLTGIAWFTALFLPLVAIVSVLAVLNLEHAVFSIMGGLDRDPTSADRAYSVVIMLTLISYTAAPVLFVMYLIACVSVWNNSRTQLRNS